MIGVWLSRAARGARLRLVGVYAALALTLVIGLVIVLSFTPVERPGVGASWWPVLASLALIGGLAVLVSRGRQVHRTLEPSAVSREADRAAGLGEGDILAALELGGGEQGLAAHHRARIEGRLSTFASDRLLPETSRLWRRRIARTSLVVSGALLALLLSSALRPGPTRAAAAALATPWRSAFPPPLPRLDIRTVDEAVPAGQPVSVVVAAVGRSSVRLTWQTVGEVSRSVELEVDDQGVARGRTDPLRAALLIWATDEAGGTSDTLRLRPAEPLLVEDLRVRLDFPPYLGRLDDEHRGPLPLFIVPEGTALHISGRTNLQLTGAALQPDSSAEPRAGGPLPVVTLATTGAGFEGSFTPLAPGVWRWALIAPSGHGEPVLPGPLEVLVVPDGPPRIELLFPAPDTTLGVVHTMPLVVDVEDDAGLRSATVEWWRSGTDSRVRNPLAPDPQGRRRVAFRHLLDLRSAELLPGDTVFYRVEASDGHPGRGPAGSDTFLLRIPTLLETRVDRARESDERAEEARDLVDQIADLARAAREAERRTTTEPEAAEDDGPSAFESTEEARAVEEQAERAQERLAELEERLEGMRAELADSPLSDPALAAQLEELTERFQELMQNGLQAQLDELARALEDLDADSIREALSELADRSGWLREQIEQTLATLERAALEQTVKSARSEAEALTEQQRRAAADTASAESFAAREEALAEDASDLAFALDQLEQRLDEAGLEASADSVGAAGEAAGDAAADMEAAAAAARQDPGAGTAPGQEARDAAARASQAMQQASDALGSAAGDLGEEGRDAAARALARARTEALDLAGAEAELSDATTGPEGLDPDDWRARQSAIRQGLDNLLRELSREAGQDAGQQADASTAAGEAARQMDELLERLAEGALRRMPSRLETDRIAGSLNDLAMRLLAGERALRGQEGQSQQEAASEQMNALAQQQQSLTRQTSSLLMPGPRPAGSETREQEVASRQQEIADDLRELGSDDSLLGDPQRLAEEAEQLARQLEADGPSTSAVDRQRKLFQRMLDAGRSLEDEDLDPTRRESETGQAPPAPVPDIDPELLRGRRFPLPGEALLEGLPLFYRPLIFEYFDRLNRPPRPPAAARPPADDGPVGGA